MIKDNTVLILGAGTSLQYSCPSAPELVKNIYQLLGKPTRPFLPQQINT